MERENGGPGRTEGAPWVTLPGERPRVPARGLHSREVLACAEVRPPEEVQAVKNRIFYD